MRQCIVLVENFNKQVKGDTLTLDDAEQFFALLLSNSYHRYYKMFGLESLVVSAVLPLVRIISLLCDCMVFLQIRKQLFNESWQPLKDTLTNNKVELMKRWRKLVEDANAVRARAPEPGQKMDAYHRLVWEAWMPSVRRCACDLVYCKESTLFSRYIREEWQPKEQCGLMVDWLDVWSPCIPAWVKDNLLTQCLLPRISDAVEK